MRFKFLKKIGSTLIKFYRGRYFTFARKFITNLGGLFIAFFACFEGYFIVKSQMGARNSADIYIKIGDELYQEEEYGQALMAYNKALEVAPFKKQAFVGKTKAQSLVISKKYGFKNINILDEEDTENIAELFTNSRYLLNEDSTDADAYKIQGIANLLSGDFDKAQLSFEYSSRFNLNDNILIWQGVLAKLMDKTQLATDYFVKALSQDSTNSSIYLNLGLLEYEAKNYEDAIRHYDNALKIDSAYILALNNRGNAYARLRKFDLAVEDYSKAIELNPSYKGAYQNRSEVYRALRKQKEAKADKEKLKTL